MENIVLIGGGGHAKSVADCIERNKEFNIVGYVDKEETWSKYKYLGTDDVLPKLYEEGVKYAFVCIGYLGKGNARTKIYTKLKEIGYLLPVILDPSSIVGNAVTIGEGTFVGKGAILNADAQIGKMVIVNTKALVEHDCIIGDFAHVAVAAVLCGQVSVGTEAFIGANATIIQGRTISPCQIVPAGDTVR